MTLMSKDEFWQAYDAAYDVDPKVWPFFVHTAYWTSIVEAAGLQRFKSIVEGIEPLEKIRECYAEDRHLNNIPLKRWDMRAGLVEVLIAGPIRKSQGRGVTLSDTTCALKTAAKLLAHRELVAA